MTTDRDQAPEPDGEAEASGKPAEGGATPPSAEPDRGESPSADTEPAIDLDSVRDRAS